MIDPEMQCVHGLSPAPFGLTVQTAAFSLRKILDEMDEGNALASLLRFSKVAQAFSGALRALDPIHARTVQDNEEEQGRFGDSMTGVAQGAFHLPPPGDLTSQILEQITESAKVILGDRAADRAAMDARLERNDHREKIALLLQARAQGETEVARLLETELGMGT